MKDNYTRQLEEILEEINFHMWSSGSALSGHPSGEKIMNALEKWCELQESRGRSLVEYRN